MRKSMKYTKKPDTCVDVAAGVPHGRPDAPSNDAEDLFLGRDLL